MTTDFLAELGLIALGSRLRRVSDRLIQDTNAIYRGRPHEFEATWFPLIRWLAAREQSSVGEAAEHLGQTHAAISQACTMLARRKLVRSRRDREDKRKRVVELSERGRALVRELGPTWAQISAALVDVIGPQRAALLRALERIEGELGRRSLLERVTAEPDDELSIVGYDPELRSEFERLNRQWLERDFTVEAVDRRMFADPYETIISAGGHILFARARGAIVGTCALVRQGDAFELCKMAVDERARGRGIGEQLLVHAIDWARRRRAERIELVTNRRLTPAIALYSKHGFMVTGCGAHPKYARCDLSMALALLGAPGL